MKIFKYLLGIIAILALLFIAAGFITPSISYHSEITVDKSIEEAWAVMSDESKISEWLKEIKKTEHVSGEKGAVGAVTKYTFVEKGQETFVFEKIKEVRPNELMSMDFTMEGAMTMDYKMEFSDKDGKTHIKSSTIAKGDGMFMRSMVSFLTSTMQEQEDVNMNNLKNVINENTTDYFLAPIVEETVEAMVE